MRIVTTLTFVVMLSFCIIIPAECNITVSDAAGFVVPVDRIDDTGKTGIYDETDLRSVGTGGPGAVPWGLGLDYVLMADIPMSNTLFEPIGTDTDPFTGTFNGNGYIISGMVIDSSLRYVGMFGHTAGATMVLENIALENGSVLSTSTNVASYAGGLVGWSEGSVRNCYNTGTVSSNETDIRLGGLVGYKFDGVIEHCSNSGDISGVYIAGGILGGSHKVSLKDCYNSGNVTGEIAGGMGGYIFIRTIENCYNSGNITGEIAGGIAGETRNVATETSEVISCGNTGTINGIGDWPMTGGISASMTNTERTIVENCWNSGMIQSAGMIVYSGGIIGMELSYFLEINACYNSGPILAYATGIGSMVGGISAYASSISNCYNLGEISFVSFNGWFAGIGFADTMDNCYNIGRIQIEDIQNTVDGLAYFSSPTDSYNISDTSSGDHDRIAEELRMPYDAVDNPNTFVGWDFNNVWTFEHSDELNVGFPILRDVGPVKSYFTQQSKDNDMRGSSTSDEAVFEVIAVSYHTMDRQWEYLKDLGSGDNEWEKLSGETSPRLVLDFTDMMSYPSGTLFRCVIYDDEGRTLGTSEPSELLNNNTIIVSYDRDTAVIESEYDTDIITHPADWEWSRSEVEVFSVLMRDASSTIQWQRYDESAVFGVWVNMPGMTNDRLFEGQLDSDSKYYRAIVTLFDATEVGSIFAVSYPHHTITSSVDGMGGDIEHDLTRVRDGDTVTFTISPQSGYRVDSVKDNGSPVSVVGQGGVLIYTVSNVTVDHDVIVSFSKIPTPTPNRYVITLTSDGGSTVSPDGRHDVSEGLNFTFTYSAKSGYVISDVIIDGTSRSDLLSDGSFTFSNIKSSHTVSIVSQIGRDDATFTIDIVEGKGYAEYSIDGHPFVRYVSPVSFTSSSDLMFRAIADDGYTFERWTGHIASDKEEILVQDAKLSIVLEIHFETDDDMFQYIVGMCLLILLALLLIFLLFVRRRFDVTIDVLSETVVVEGKDKAQRKRRYVFKVDGASSIRYKVGDDGGWSVPHKGDGNTFIIPAEDVVDNITIEAD